MTLGSASERSEHRIPRNSEAYICRSKPVSDKTNEEERRLRSGDLLLHRDPGYHVHVDQYVAYPSFFKTSFIVSSGESLFFGIFLSRFITSHCFQCEQTTCVSRILVYALTKFMIINRILVPILTKFMIIQIILNAF